MMVAPAETLERRLDVLGHAMSAPLKNQDFSQTKSPFRQIYENKGTDTLQLVVFYRVSNGEYGACYGTTFHTISKYHPTQTDIVPGKRLLRVEGEDKELIRKGMLFLLERGQADGYYFDKVLNTKDEDGFRQDIAEMVRYATEQLIRPEKL